MISRILPILSLLAAVAIGFYLWSSGTLGHLLIPKVQTIAAARNMEEGEALQASAIEIRAINIKDIKAGMIVFPEGVKPEAIEALVSRQELRSPVQKGEFIQTEMLGSKVGLFAIQPRRPIEAGHKIDPGSIRAQRITGAVPPGTVVFDSDVAATGYVIDSYNLSLRRTVNPSQVLTFEDMTSSGGIYALHARRSMNAGASLRMEDVGIDMIVDRNIPEGMIAFPSEEAARGFIAATQGSRLVEPVAADQVITAQLLAAPQEDEAIVSLKPRTRQELEVYRVRNPDTVILVPNSMMLGKPQREDGAIDLWIETGKTEGDFGQVEFSRLATGIQLNSVVEDTPSAPEGRGAMAAAVALAGNEPSMDLGVAGLGEQGGMPNEVDPELPLSYWVETDPEIVRLFREARLSQDRVAFAILTGEDVIGALGNGTVCLEGECVVDRRATGDLLELKARLQPMEEEDPSASGDGRQLLLLDGVNPALALRMAQAGYDSPEAIAAWANVDAVGAELGMSPQKAEYIRRQATEMISSRERILQAMDIVQPPQM